MDGWLVDDEALCSKDKDGRPMTEPDDKREAGFWCFFFPLLDATPFCDIMGNTYTHTHIHICWVGFLDRFHHGFALASMVLLLDDGLRWTSIGTGNINTWEMYLGENSCLTFIHVEICSWGGMIILMYPVYKVGRYLEL